MDDNRVFAIFIACVTIVMLAFTVTHYLHNVQWNEIILKGGYTQDSGGRWVKAPMPCEKEH